MGLSTLGPAAEAPKVRRRFLERLRSAGVNDPRVLRAFAEVPRHLLVPEALRDRAYQETPIPIGEGQTISAPGVVASMTMALQLEGHERVLEIGTGSGYQAAILSRLVSQVISIERIPKLAASARTALDGFGVTNVIVYLGDGTRGRPDLAPYDRIVVTAGGPEVPKPLLEQLAPGGMLVGPFGVRGHQKLTRVRVTGDGRLTREVIGECDFVDLIGQNGWQR
ncbi:MAG: protein-L-isoaspartate(D-aspartate) O-methyltransferase [bacterium]|nr:protein-L-isoaspartate(D-aspartate) O-methyltransferase [bacterium]